MNQKNNYLLNILIVPFLFTFSSNMAMITIMFKPMFAVSFAERLEQTKREKRIAEIKKLSTIDAVDHEIDTLKNNIYQECLTELASIIDTPYDSLQKRINRKRAFIKKTLHKNSDSPKNHDPNIPSSMYQQLIRVISEMQINPNNIDLKYITSSETSGLLASANSGASQKPYIKIYSGLSEHSHDSQNFIYHHELQHILLDHPSIHSTISLFNESYNSSQKSKLISIQEREANIHAAAANINNARMGVEKSCIFSHPEIINQKEHCTEMVIMYKLMKQKEKLSKEASHC
jgi:hypothetical protein